MRAFIRCVSLSVFVLCALSCPLSPVSFVPDACPLSPRVLRPSFVSPDAPLRVSATKSAYKEGRRRPRCRLFRNSYLFC
jgi:hypothetical protein